MSQDIRRYDTCRVDGNDDEARRVGVTATVGPTGHGEIDPSRGVQLTLEAPSGYTYARLSQPQVRDLIDTLCRRLDPEDEEYEATMYGAGDRRVLFDGEVIDE